jgi:hypothetical protein
MSTEPEKEKCKRRPPKSLFALGYVELPAEVETEGVKWRFSQLFKHDFFAATGLYEAVGAVGGALVEGEVPGAHHTGGTPALPLAVLKVQRTYPLYGFPMKWLGRRVANHEIRIYEKLQGVRGVPKFLGRVGPTGFLHAFIPGTDLHANLPLTPAFFEDLRALFAAVHERHVAYVDSNKRENILYGEDGRPWLIDFQISFECKKGERANFLVKSWFRRFVRADWYHYYKHKTRLLPSACTLEDFAGAEKRGILHQVQRVIARPIIQVRRKFLSRYDLAKTR